MKYANLFVGVGLIILSVSILLKYTLDLPDFISGLGVVIGLGIELYGVYLLKNKGRY